MQLSRQAHLRACVGAMLGHVALNGVLALGLMLLIPLILNGFSTDATLRFIDNFTSRMVEADASGAARFSIAVQLAWGVLFILITIVRWLDEVWLRRRRNPQGAVS